MPGAKVVYASLVPPPTGGTKVASARDWTVNMEELRNLINPHTKMIVLNTPYVPISSTLIAHATVDSRRFMGVFHKILVTHLQDIIN